MIWFGLLRWPIHNSSGRSWFQETPALRPVNVDGEHILPAGRHLAHGECTARPIAQAQKHRAKIVGVDRNGFVIARLQRLARECLHRSFGLVAASDETSPDRRTAP